MAWNCFCCWFWRCRWRVCRKSSFGAYPRLISSSTSWGALRDHTRHVRSGPIHRLPQTSRVRHVVVSAGIYGTSDLATRTVWSWCTRWKPRPRSPPPPSMTRKQAGLEWQVLASETPRNLFLKSRLFAPALREPAGAQDSPSSTGWGALRNRTNARKH
ncbi:hypothetical protein B0H63DRAFT_191904 [Podospora didyma]|uniref:Uncharacterized protein n=1 Tax=Podospora didyma TaxID=330526 RepID=A0AAE0NRD2_9PEZI|nr:hypothetical protein B0H63DRAFT_191904 [Podospora didyma]